MIAHLQVGHQTLLGHGTGLSVFLCGKRASANFFLCGNSPASRDLAILQAGRDGLIDALVFSGGSAYGLGATNGVMEWLKDHGRGYYPVPSIIVPIVPAVGIFDLTVKSSIYPTAADGYQACKNAKENNLLCGLIGVGCGATVGKWRGLEYAQPGGFGMATIKQQQLIVQSYVVVNSVGNVYNDTGKIIAGDNALTQNNFPEIARFQQVVEHNTTLVAVFTNATLDRYELFVIAKMASAGIARAIYPSFTPYDGDIVFAVSLGEEIQASVAYIGHLAAMATQQAIMHSVTHYKHDT